MFHGCWLGFTVAEEVDAGSREKGFKIGVAFVAVNCKDHDAFVFDVAVELVGGVTGFVKTLGRVFVV